MLFIHSCSDFSDFESFHASNNSFVIGVATTSGGLFVQVVRLARECGLVKLGTVAVDGTKLKAQIDGLLNRAKAADDLEKNDPEPILFGYAEIRSP